MKHSRKTTVYLLLAMLLFTGCEQEATKQGQSGMTSTEISGESDESTENASTDTSGDSAEKKQTSADGESIQSTAGSDTNAGDMAPPVTREVPIYTIDEDTLETKATVVTVPESYELTPELIVDLVIDDFADKSYEISVDDVYTEGENIVVDFLGDTPPVVEVQSEVETTILDAIAQSLMDNVEEYSGVIYRVGNQQYQSENQTFGLDEVYLSK